MPERATPSLVKSIGGSVEERIQYVEQQFRRALDATASRRDRLYANMSYYFGDQIPDIIKTKMAREKREPIVYNIAQRKVSGLVGSLLRNNFDIQYVSVDGSNSTLIMATQDMLKADQNSGNWDYQLMSWIKYGLIEEGIMELTTSDRESPLGNLVFECTQPGSVIIDPNWRTNNSRDMEEAFKYIYLSPRQILDIFPDSEDTVKSALLEGLRQGRDYEQSDVNANANYETTLGGDYMVLQHTYTVGETVGKEMDIQSGTELPETEDIEYKKQWITLNGLNPEYIRVIRYRKRVVKTCTIVPALNLRKPLAEGPHPLQIERLPFFPWSPERIQGQTYSIIDIVKSMSDVLNKRENLVNNILENAAHGGGAVDPAIVGNDPDQKRLIEQNWSNPKFKFWTQEGALAAGKKYFQEVPKASAPNEVFAQINHLWEAIDRVLPINAAADGRAESSQESGILFSMKQNAIEIAQTTLIRGLMGMLTEMGDAYFRAAKFYYSNVERTFVKPNGETFSINEVLPLPSGDIGIMNDLSSLQNLKTLVKMGADSPNSRYSRRVTALDLLKVVPPNLQSLQVAIIAELINTVDLDESVKKTMDEAMERSKELAVERENSEMVMLKSQAAQAMQALQAPPAGAPVPGQDQPPPPEKRGLSAALAPLMAQAAGD